MKTPFLLHITPPDLTLSRLNGFILGVNEQRTSLPPAQNQGRTPVSVCIAQIEFSIVVLRLKKAQVVLLSPGY